MKYCLQFLPGSGICKHGMGKFIPAKSSVTANYVASERVLDLVKSRLTRLDHGSREVIRVHHGNATRLQPLGGGGFSHADPASESYGFHSNKKTAVRRAQLRSETFSQATLTAWRRPDRTSVPE